MVTKLQLRIAEAFGVNREYSGVRDYDIARRAGIYPSRLSEYVQGRRDIPPHDQIALCELLGCAPEDITGIADPNEYDFR